MNYELLRDNPLNADYQSKAILHNNIELYSYSILIWWTTLPDRETPYNLSEFVENSLAMMQYMKWNTSKVNKKRN